MSGGEGGKRWLAWGCFGCLGLLLLLVGVAAVVLLVAKREAGAERVEQHSLSRELPSAVETAELPPVESTEATTTIVPAATAGRVVLELADAEFDIRPAAPGEPLQVEATYDTASYTLEERYEGGDGTPWTYRVTFRRSGSMMMALLKQIFGASSPQVHVRLPVDVPFALDARLEKGGATTELGGLWLTDLDFHVDKGGFDLRVSEPLREPAERVAITGSMGGFAVSGLGNASPRELLLDIGMGGAGLDLRGPWQRDAEVTINLRMSGAALQLPQDVAVEGLDIGEFEVGGTEEVRPPTLTFSVTKDKRSELEIKR